MAADQTEKRRNLARRLVSASTTLMQIVAELDACADEYTSAGLTFVDGDFTDIPGLEHLDAAKITAVITSAGNLKTWITSTFNDDIFQAARP